MRYETRQRERGRPTLWRTTRERSRRRELGDRSSGGSAQTGSAADLTGRRRPVSPNRIGSRSHDLLRLPLSSLPLALCLSHLPAESHLRRNPVLAARGIRDSGFRPPVRPPWCRSKSRSRSRDRDRKKRSRSRDRRRRRDSRSRSRSKKRDSPTAAKDKDKETKDEPASVDGGADGAAASSTASGNGPSAELEPAGAAKASQETTEGPRQEEEEEEDGDADLSKYGDVDTVKEA